MSERIRTPRGVAADLGEEVHRHPAAGETLAPMDPWSIMGPSITVQYERREVEGNYIPPGNKKGRGQYYPSCGVIRADDDGQFRPLLMFAGFGPVTE